MLSFKIFTVLLVASSVYTNPLNDGMEKIFKQFAAGDAEKGIKPMDPMTIENINYPEEALGINSHFPELLVTGLKDAVVTDYSKNDKDVANLELTFSLDAEGPVTLQFPKKNKDLKGTIKYEADIKAHVTYSVANNEIGPETITCEASNAKYTIGEKFIQVLENDPDASAMEPQYDKIHNEHVKNVSCEFAKSMLKVVVENFRAFKTANV